MFEFPGRFSAGLLLGDRGGLLVLVDRLVPRRLRLVDGCSYLSEHLSLESNALWF